jgi:hypothetical protein
MKLTLLEKTLGIALVIVEAESKAVTASLMILMQREGRDETVRERHEIPNAEYETCLWKHLLTNCRTWQLTKCYL